MANNSQPTAPAGSRLVPQPHCGALVQFAAGRDNPGRWRKRRRAAMSLLQDAVIEASRRLLELVRSLDPRVSLMASIEVLNRTLGKPTDMPQGDETGAGAIDVSALHPEERAELTGHLAAVRRLRELAQARRSA